jgi:hypothetical protein
VCVLLDRCFDTYVNAANTYLGKKSGLMNCYYSSNNLFSLLTKGTLAIRLFVNGFSTKQSDSSPLRHFESGFAFKVPPLALRELNFFLSKQGKYMIKNNKKKIYSLVWPIITCLCGMCNNLKTVRRTQQNPTPWRSGLEQCMDMSTSEVPMSSSPSKIVSHVWVCGVEKGRQAWGRGEAIGVWETEQSTFNMGPEWKKAHNLS